MALNREKISLPFAAGIDTKTDEKQLNDKLLELENGRFLKAGKIQKRFGTVNMTTAIEGGGTLSDIAKITVKGDEKIALSDGKLYKYSVALDAWVLIDGASSVSVEEDIYSASGKYYGSVAISGNYKCIVGDISRISSSTVAEISYSVIDNTTGSVLVNDEKITTLTTKEGVHGSVFANDNKFFFVWYDIQNNQKIFYRTLTIATLALSATVEVMTTSATIKAHDFILNGNEVVIAAVANGVTDDIEIHSIDIDTLVDTTDTVTSANTTSSLGLAVDSENRIWCSFAELAASNYTIKAFTLEADLTSIMGITTVFTPPTGGLVTMVTPVVITNGTTGAFHTYTNHLTNTTGGVDVSMYKGTVYEAFGLFTETFSGSFTLLDDRVFEHQSIVSHKPFSPNQEDIYVPMMYIDTHMDLASSTTNAEDQSGSSFYYVVKTQTTTLADFEKSIVAKFLKFNTIRDYTLGIRGGQNMMAPTIVLDGDNYALACLRVLEILDADNYTVAQSIITLDLENEVTLLPSENKLITSGSVVKEFDGIDYAEAGFLKAPEIRVISELAFVPATPASTYALTCTYEWRDNQGNLTRSALSRTQNYTLTAEGFMIVDVENLSITDRVAELTSDKLFIRTHVTDGSFSFDRVDEVDTSSTDSVIQLVIGSSVNLGSVLYTDSGELEEMAPEDANILINAKDRIFYVGGILKNTVYYSKIIQETGIIEYNSNLFFDVIGEGPEITALGEMDDKLIIFKETGIFYVGGDGPDNTGSNNTFTKPTLISADVGCINQNSVVLTAEGLMFKSNKGIYMLTRSLQTVYIGAEVENYNTDTIVAANMLDDFNEVRFLTNNRCLVYNYYFKQWSIFTYSGTHAAIIDNTYYIANDTVISNEDTSLFTDNALHVALKVTTNWLSLNAVQNLQRIYFMHFIGDYLSAHSLKVTTAYDFDDTNTDTVTIDSADEYTTASVYQMKVFFKQQKCSAIKITLEDIQASNFGEGLNLSNILITYGRKRSGQTMSDSQRFSTE